MATPKARTPGKPADYELVLLTIRRTCPIKGVIEREIVGWWNGWDWDGARLMDEDQVLCWKKGKGGLRDEF